MLIVIEGVDKCGKSTLAAALARRLRGEVRHYSAPVRHPLTEYERDLDDYVPGSGRHVIIDRLHWGETIWPEIFDRPSAYTAEMFYHTELYLQSRGALMIHAKAPEFDVIARLAGSPYPPRDKVGRALELFQAASDRSMLPVLGYDFRRWDRSEFVDLATFGAGRLEELVVKPWGVTGHWVGAAVPNLLLVGDRPGPGTRDPDGRDPGVVPFRPYGGSATYLMAALLRTNYFPALTNVRGRRKKTDLRGLWLALGKPRVVALGDEADAALSGFEVPHGVVRHPQYLRRFEHRRLGEYPALLKRAARGEDTR